VTIENPKTALGRMKLSATTVPTKIWLLDMAAHEYGTAKYGQMNWRKAGIPISIYLDAIKRHLMELKAGYDIDDGPQGSGLPHVIMIRANCAIIYDAGDKGMLDDDREKDPGLRELAIELAGRKAQWVHDAEQSRREPQPVYSETLEAA
jgi:hypothetical protein